MCAAAARALLLLALAGAARAGGNVSVQWKQ